MVLEHLFSLSPYRLEKRVVISSAEVKVISVYPWVCAGPKKSKKEPERRWGGGEDERGVRASLTALPTWWKEMKMVSDSFFYH